MKKSLFILGIFFSLIAFANAATVASTKQGTTTTVYKKSESGKVVKVSSAEVTTTYNDGTVARANLICEGTCSGTSCGVVNGCEPMSRFCSQLSCGGTSCTSSCTKTVSKPTGPGND